MTRDDAGTPEPDAVPYNGRRDVEDAVPYRSRDWNISSNYPRRLLPSDRQMQWIKKRKKEENRLYLKTVLKFKQRPTER